MEVGKRYKWNQAYVAGYRREFTCIHVTPEGNGVVKYDDGYEGFVYKNNAYSNNYSEVRAPRKIKKYIGVFCNSLHSEKIYISAPYESEESCRRILRDNGWTVLDVITIDWTEKV